MFGLFFINHSNLQRLLVDYGFIGYPLRKDFPVIGFIEIYYNEKKNKILYAPVELVQEYRNIYFYKL